MLVGKPFYNGNKNEINIQQIQYQYLSNKTGMIMFCCKFVLVYLPGSI